MSRSRGGLGRGLASLIPAGPDSPISNVIISPLAAPVSRETTADQHGASHQPVSAGTAAQHVSRETGAQDGVSRETTPVSHPHPLQQRSSDATPGATTPDGPYYQEIPIAQISANPSNPRTNFDEDALAELQHSLREFGVLQPIVVRRKAAGGYELVMGERRWRAAEAAGLSSIPAIVRRTEDAHLLRDALLENIHRANLNPLEEAAAYQQLLEEFEVTHDELAARLGRSRPVISNTIRLLKLPVPVQRRVAAGVISAGHARALLALDDPAQQEELAARVVAEGLSVRGTEEAATILAGRKRSTRRAPATRHVTPAIEDLAAELGDHLDTRVRVELARRRGRLIIEFGTVDDLVRIAELIQARQQQNVA